MKNLKTDLIKLITSFVVLASRVVIKIPNLKPVGSFGFFGGDIFLFLIPTLFFDILWGGFYKGFIFTYLGFLAYFVLGKIAKNNTKKQIALLPLASLLFFLLSNLGSWIYFYPHTLSGLILCYTLALPFYKSTLIGDIFFGYGFLAMKSVAKLAKVEQKNFVKA